jgi:hypothetical protein
MTTIQDYFLILLCRLIRDQNEQLLRIICDDYGKKYHKELIPSDKKIKKYVESL